MVHFSNGRAMAIVQGFLKLHSRNPLLAGWFPQITVDDTKYLQHVITPCYCPNHSKTRAFKIWKFLTKFQMVFDKMVHICLDFKWLGFRISDPI